MTRPFFLRADVRTPWSLWECRTRGSRGSATKLVDRRVATVMKPRSQHQLVQPTREAFLEMAAEPPTTSASRLFKVVEDFDFVDE